MIGSAFGPSNCSPRERLRSRLRLRTLVRAALRSMLSSHVRNWERPSYCERCTNADVRVSWTTSSASASLRRKRNAVCFKIGIWRENNSSIASRSPCLASWSNSSLFADANSETSGCNGSLLRRYRCRTPQRYRTSVRAKVELRCRNAKICQGIGRISSQIFTPYEELKNYYWQVVNTLNSTSDSARIKIGEGVTKVSKHRVLVIDDDVELWQLLSQYLAQEGFLVEAVHSGLSGVEAAISGAHSIVVLDVMLPDVKGFEVLRRIRAKSRVPVLMLTARGDDQDRILGLELGADDYLPKPFNPRELSARVKAILRRTEARVNRGKVEINGVALDPGAREVTCDGKPVEVTTLEFDILEQLMRNAGRVVSRDGLMESLYNRKATPFDRSIDMHFSHLRRKLESSRPVIKTIRGVGYQFCQSPEDAVAG